MHNCVLNHLASLKKKKNLKINKKCFKKPSRSNIKFIHGAYSEQNYSTSQIAQLPPQMITDIHEGKRKFTEELQAFCFPNYCTFSIVQNCINIGSPSNIYVYPKQTGKGGHPVVNSVVSSHVSQVVGSEPGEDKKPPSSHQPIPKSVCVLTLVPLSKL